MVLIHLQQQQQEQQRATQQTTTTTEAVARPENTPKLPALRRYVPVACRARPNTIHGRTNYAAAVLSCTVTNPTA